MPKIATSSSELSIYNNSGIKNAVHHSTALWTDAPKIPDISTFISIHRKHESKKIPQEVSLAYIPAFQEFQNMVIASKHIIFLKQECATFIIHIVHILHFNKDARLFGVLIWIYMDYFPMVIL